MPKIEFNGRYFETLPEEKVLDALLRNGLDVPFSCKGGSCLTCMLQCADGAVPAAAQQGLSEHLQRMRYFLPCQCVPESDLSVRLPQPMDLLTPSYFCESTHLPDGQVQVVFEPQRTLRYRTGQTIGVVTGEPLECVLRLVSDPERDFVVTAVADAETATRLPAWLQPGAEFGYAFDVRGPFDERLPDELPYPTPDPGLWAELDNGRIARRVFESFYAKVYADPLLSPFFAKVTIDRSIDKQYSFFRQCVAGEKIYMGDRPRNAHHWMIISHELFEHRQALMVQTLREHGLDDALIKRWTRFEEYFRPDIVKTSQWPRQIGGELVMQDGFATEVLGEASLCDHCAQPVDAGATVLYHKRLGTIACEQCAAHGLLPATP